MPLGRTIKLFMVDGVPTGVVIAELSLFTGQAIIAPRAAMTDLLARKEAQKAGVYILIGPDPEIAGLDKIYVGETNRIVARLAQHDADTAMEFFDRICIMVSKNEALTKGHCLYLENSLIREIKAARRVGLINVKTPEPSGLPEADCADMDGFLEQIRIMLPILGFDIFKNDRLKANLVSNPAASSSENDIKFSYQINGATAQMEQRDGRYVILTGSTAVATETDSIPANVRTQRVAMLADGRLVEYGRFYRFTVDVGFGSPSAASCAIAGRSDNGRVSWKQVGTGIALGDLSAPRTAPLSLEDLDIEL